MFFEHNEGFPRQKGSGWIEVIAGSMFSGKTEELIRRLKRSQIAGQKVEIFKPVTDRRYDKKDVVSHDENAIPSVPIREARHILRAAEEVDVVGIDEAQFFDDPLPELCNELANQGLRVIVAGLDMDHEGKPFGPMPQLMAVAEFVTKVHAICMRTGELAQFSYRKTGSREQIELGGREQYEPLSRKAYFELMREKDQKPREEE